jgi:hypothetical protein
MKKSRRLKGLKRSIAVATLLTGLAGGATFAALQSQQDTLTGNLISTASANLLLSNDGTTFTSSQSGFDFNNIVPGGPAQPATGYSFYLKNTGGTALDLKLYVSSTPSNPSSINLSKVNIVLTPVGSGTTAQTFSLQSLIDAKATGGLAITGSAINAGLTQQDKLQVSMTSDAVVQNSANLGNIDFAFIGQTQ